jgi:ribonuclease HII
VAAVILDPANPIAGLDDSKRLSAARREFLFPLITQKAIAWSIVEVPADTIDALNILQATLWGMQQAVERLSAKPSRILIDGNRAPVLSGEVHTIVQGDRLEPAISAASILAKVSRDKTMRTMHELYPGYGFDQHKGYPTSLHLRQLELFGPCQIHRRSFAPVKRLLEIAPF